MRFGTMIGITVVTVLMAVVVMVGCAADSGDSSNPSKLQLCNEMADAYCGRLAQMSCPEATGCLQEQKSYCAQLFDGTCGAPANDIFMIREEAIPHWINPKESCDALTGIDNSLESTIMDMKASTCEGGSSAVDGDVAVDGDSGDTLEDCVEANCSSQLAACQADANCVNMINCGNECSETDTACIQQCVATYQAGLPRVEALNTCMSANCGEYL